jgi:hypothetical protein
MDYWIVGLTLPLSSPFHSPWFGHWFVPKILVYGNETAETNQGQKGRGQKKARHY